MKKNLWSMLLAILAISASAIAFTACSDDDDDNDTGGNNGGNNTEIKGDYTATTNVKTVTLKEYKNYSQGNVTIYEDFNYKYDLALYKGKMGLIPYGRKNGSWQINAYDGHPYTELIYANINIIDSGKMEALSYVSEKVEVGGKIDSPAAQPGHGYAACFSTEDGTQYLRLYISNYKLDSDGALESITVQYQLY